MLNIIKGSKCTRIMLHNAYKLFQNSKINILLLNICLTHQE